MIRSIRRKFIRIALAVLALAMVLVALVINAANWVNVRSELSETLTAIAQSGGKGSFGLRGNRGLKNRVSESQYFIAARATDGTIVLSTNSRQSEFDSAELTDIAERAFERGGGSGFVEGWLYALTSDESGVICLNCETKLASVRSLAMISAAACVGAILLAWLVVSLTSRRAIRPLIENAEQQKRFITDAGHELKTPLTVISANMDVLTLEIGENEWVRSTQKQVANMRGLVGEMIYLSHLDEEDFKLNVKPFDLSKALADVAEPFAGMAEFSGKSLAVDAGAGVVARGDEASIRRLISVLLDNAVKYAPEGDEILVGLKVVGRRAVLTVENGQSAPMDEETLKHLFDRFYRADASRSKESGGYGIGLSVARAVVERHGGELRVRQTPEGRIRFTAILPVG